MPPRSLLVVHLSLLATAAIWGGNFSAIKHLLETLEPVDVMILRVGGAAVLFVLFLLAQRGGRKRILPADLLKMFLLGLIGITIMNLGFVNGQNLIPAAMASLIVTSNPIHTTIFSSLLGIERLTARKVGGIALAMAGFVVLLLFGSGDGAELGGGHVKGILLVAVGPMSWAIYTVLSKSLVVRYGPVETAAYTTIGGAIGLLPVLLFQDGMTGRLGELSLSGWSVALYMCGLGFVVAYILWYRGLQVLSPSQTAVYIYLCPVFGLIIARVLLGEQVTRWLILGGATILAGVILTNSGGRTQPSAVGSTTASPTLGDDPASRSPSRAPTRGRFWRRTARASARPPLPTGR